MKKTFLTLLILCFSNFFSQSSNWIYLGDSKDKSIKIFVRIIENNNYSSSCWVKYVFKNKIVKNSDGTLISNSGLFYTDRWEIDCRSKKYKSYSTTFYNANGKVIGSDDTVIEDYARPDSTSEIIINFICSLR